MARLTYQQRKAGREAILEAIKIIGSREQLAALCGIASPNISMWLSQGYVPAHHVLMIEQLTNVASMRLNAAVFTPMQPRVPMQPQNESAA